MMTCDSFERHDGMRVRGLPPANSDVQAGWLAHHGRKLLDLCSRAVWGGWEGGGGGVDHMLTYCVCVFCRSPSGSCSIVAVGDVGHLDNAGALTYGHYHGYDMARKRPSTPSRL